MDSEKIVKILEEVLNERKNQYKKWGYQIYTPAEFLSILCEEVGEVAKEINDHFYENGTHRKIKNYRNELIQVAAVAVQMIEVYDKCTKRK